MGHLARALIHRHTADLGMNHHTEREALREPKPVARLIHRVDDEVNAPAAAKSHGRDHEGLPGVCEAKCD